MVLSAGAVGYVLSLQQSGGTWDGRVVVPLEAGELVVEGARGPRVRGPVNTAEGDGQRNGPCTSNSPR